VPRYQDRAGDAAYHLGNLLVSTGRATEGEKLLRRAIERRQQLVADFPRVPVYHAALRGAQEKVARLLLRREDFAGAVPLLEGAIAHTRAGVLAADPPNAQELGLLSSYRWLLADARLHLGQYREAARLAEDLPGILPRNWQECYQAARLLTRCVGLAKADAQQGSAARDDLVEQYSRRAVAWLREAFRRGCTAYPSLKTDHGLDVLRERDDFRQLLHELAGK
jgi:tetratricopeptide (TPR) repeat protein